MPPGARRLLLLELLCHRDDRCETSMFYPFLKGLAQDCGAESLWLYFVAEPRICWERPVGRTLRAHLPARDLAALRRRLKSFRPTHIVSNEILSPQLRAALSSAGDCEFLVLPCESDLEGQRSGQHQEEMAPHLARISPLRDDRLCLHKPAWFADWLGAQPHPREAEHIFDAAEPDYAAVRANTAADFQPSYPLILVGGLSCRGRPPLAGNPRFAELAKSTDLGTGCSFCGGGEGEDTLSFHRESALQLAARQLRIIEAAPPGKSRAHGSYMVYELSLFTRVDEFFRMIHEEGFRPAKFTFCPRIDDVLQARERLESVLPLIAADGHRLGFDIMGLENFSAEAMALYNKNISVAQADELVALMERWHRERPEVFPPYHGGRDWLMLLFTPWTTLAQLRTNYDEAARRGFSSSEFWICTSLLLRWGGAMAALAAREGGILVPEFPDRGMMFYPCCGMNAMWGSLPWRFKDPKVADFYRIIVRIFAAVERPDSRPLFGEDPELDLFAEIFCAARAGADGRFPRPPWTLLELARTLLDLIEAAPPPWSREALLLEAVARVKKSVLASPLRRGSGAGALAELQPLSPAVQAAIDGIGRLLREGRQRALAGLRIESARTSPRHARSIQLNLLADGRKLGLLLMDRAHPGPAVFTTRSFKAIYVKETAAWSPDQLGKAMRRLRLLVVLIERRLGPGRRAAPGKPAR